MCFRLLFPTVFPKKTIIRRDVCLSSWGIELEAQERWECRQQALSLASKCFLTGGIVYEELDIGLELAMETRAAA